MGVGPDGTQRAARNGSEEGQRDLESQATSPLHDPPTGVFGGLGLSHFQGVESSSQRWNRGENGDKHE